MQHFCTSAGDKGWGCGYKNCQMLISHLLLRGLPFRQALFGGVEYVPDIVSLQAWLECAWQQGFDPAGQHSLEGSVQGTTKWIGAIDIAALLRQFGIRVRFMDFLGRQSPHHSLYDGGTIHEGISCDFCKVQPIVGRRYSSQNVDNFDLCEHCVQTDNAENFAPFLQCGQQEIHRSTKCFNCQVSPIRGVRYQKPGNWRERLCMTCYQQKTLLEQTLYKPCLKSKVQTTDDQGHGRLMQWVWNYFAESDAMHERHNEDVELKKRFVATGKPPLFFQHDGHSRTIVGIERVVTTGRHGDVTYSLLILDPSTRAETLQNSFR